MVRPALRPDQVQTYSIRHRKTANARRVGCAEAGCEAHLHGWRTTLLLADEQTAARAHFIRTDTSRRHVEHAGPDRLVFEFEAGQSCFAEHVTERQQLYLVAGGGRARPYLHSGAGSWLDDFATNQQRLADVAARG